MKKSPDSKPRLLPKSLVPAAAACAALLTGCTAFQAGRQAESGWLQVYSEQSWGRMPEGGPVTFLYSEYKVFTPDGRFLMRVDNAGSMEDPSTVRLEPGRYIVEAQAHQRGTVRVPVTITTGKTTALHLEK